MLAGYKLLIAGVVYQTLPSLRWVGTLPTDAVIVRVHIVVSTVWIVYCPS